MTPPARGECLPFVHEACLYSSDKSFLATAVPFIEDGLSRDEPVLAAVRASNLPLLWRALGPAASRVELVDSRRFGERPPQRLTCFDRYWRRTAPEDRWVRVLTEPDWGGRSPSEITAWKLMEHNLNVLFAETNIWMICPYDTRALDEDILTAARGTHPSLTFGAGSRPNADYLDPATGASLVEDRDLPTPDRPPVLHSFDDRRSAALRTAVADFASTVHLSPGRAAELVRATQEVMQFTIEHGGGDGVLCMWTRHDEVIVEITDTIGDHTAWRPLPPVAGAPVSGEDRPEHRLWLVRQLCDRVTTTSHGHATCVRLHMLTRPW